MKMNKFFSTKIKIFITGGTFDKEYNELTGSLFVQRESSLPEMLKLARSKLDIDLTTLMMIDSLDMTDKDIGEFEEIQ